MARRKVILPNWSANEADSKSIEMLGAEFSGLTQGELVINTNVDNTLLSTLNGDGKVVVFESSEMIDKRLEGFLDKVHQHDNKDVLDSITSGRTDAWDKAESNAKTYTDQQIDFIVSGASEAFDTLKEVETWIYNHSGQADTMITSINAISGVAHTHDNKSLLDIITLSRIELWDEAEPNVITEISAVTKDNSNVISVNGKKVTIDLTNVGDENVIETIKVNNSALTVSDKTVNVDLSYLETAIENIELTPGPKGDDGITPVFTAITANVNNVTGEPYVSVTSAKTDEEKYTLAFNFQNLKGEKGDKGDDGTSIKILGTVNSPAEFPGLPNNGDGYMLDGHLWVYDGVSWVDAGEIKGPQGDPGTNAYINAVTASVSDTTGVPTVKVTTGGTHSEMTIDFDFDNLKGPKGDKGTSIASIGRTGGNGTAGTTDVYTITYSDGTTSTFNVYNGADGKDGENGDDGITPVFTSVDATINNDEGTPSVSVTSAKTDGEKYSLVFNFTNLKGEKGPKGEDGTSVKILGTKNSNDELPSSNNVNGDGYIIGENLWVWNGSIWQDVGKVKGPQGDPGTNAYISAVTASVSNTTGTPSVAVTTAGTSSNISFNLAFNGLKGEPGDDGENGIGIKSFVKTSGNGAAGTTDTYTITFTNGVTSAITVYNGSNGTNGEDGQDGAPGAPGAPGTNGSTWYNGITAPSTETGVNGDWYLNTLTWDISYKESNSWITKGNIKGETGSFDDSALSNYALRSEIPDISGKVDKVNGKGLSTNDFTNDLKTKLDGVAAGAEVNVQSDWNATSGDALILNKPSLATVATSGSYNDLSNTPTIPDISGKVDKVNGKGLSTNDFTNDLKTKLDGIAAGAEVNVQSDWNETTTTSDAYIKNKPTLATVATSGSYNDLSNKPTLFSGDYNDLTNKPTLFSGNYNDLTNKPTIPSVDGFIKNISLVPSTEKLYIVGSTSISGSTTSLNTSSTDVYISGGEVYAASDERLKDFGDNVEVDFNKLSEIPKVYYSWKDDEEKKQMIGTSAQKLKEIYPELVSENEDGKMAVSYEKLSIIALAAVDKLHKENEELKDRLKRIEEKLGL